MKYDTDIMIAFYCLHSVERIVSINFRKYSPGKTLKKYFQTMKK